MSRRVLLTALSALWVLGVVVADGQAQSRKRSRSASDDMYRSLPVDDMVRQAAENVSRRYNLNPDQTQFTQDMMAKRVYRFLDEHEDEIWPIIRDMSRYQNPNSKLPRKAAMQMGKAIKPLFMEAQQAILDANGEWREILSDEQKKLHDYDLDQMQKSFNDLDKRFENWSKGKVTQESGIFPSEQVDRPPVDPKMPKLGQTTADGARAMNTEWWDGYVNGFIRNFELDDAQITTARSILKELKERAEAYKKSRKEEYARVQKKLDAADKAQDLDKLNEAIKEKRELNEFIAALFTELKSRLDKIPRTAQRQKAESRHKKFEWDHRPIGKPVTADEGKTKSTSDKGSATKKSPPEGKGDAKGDAEKKDKKKKK